MQINQLRYHVRTVLLVLIALQLRKVQLRALQHSTVLDEQLNVRVALLDIVAPHKHLHPYRVVLALIVKEIVKHVRLVLLDMHVLLHNHQLLLLVLQERILSVHKIHAQDVLLAVCVPVQQWRRL